MHEIQTKVDINGSPLFLVHDKNSWYVEGYTPDEQYVMFDLDVSTPASKVRTHLLLLGLSTQQVDQLMEGHDGNGP